MDKKTSISISSEWKKNAKRQLPSNFPNCFSKKLKPGNYDGFLFNFEFCNSVLKFFFIESYSSSVDLIRIMGEHFSLFYLFLHYLSKLVRLFNLNWKFQNCKSAALKNTMTEKRQILLFSIFLLEKELNQNEEKIETLSMCLELNF